MACRGSRKHETKGSRRLFVFLALSSVAHLILLVYLRPQPHVPHDSTALQISFTSKPPQTIKPAAPLTPASRSHTSPGKPAQLARKALQDGGAMQRTTPPAPVQPASAEQADTIFVPRSVEIAFDLYGGNGEPLGKALQHYEADDAGNYRLTYGSPATGEPERSWQIEIVGKISAQHGLSPRGYQLNGDIARRLLFPSDAAATTVDPDSPQSGNMPDGVLDFVSLPYQLMLISPEIGALLQNSEDGTIQGIYRFHIIGEETLQTDLYGLLKTLHVEVSIPGKQESTELWLSPTHHYLPIKVRSRDSNGNTIEQRAASLTSE